MDDSISDLHEQCTLKGQNFRNMGNNAEEKFELEYNLKMGKVR